MSRLQQLKDLHEQASLYTQSGGDHWRPAYLDLYTYTILQELYVTDLDDGSYVWGENNPDSVMESIINSGRYFDIEYGFEDLYDSIRDYLIIEDFIDSPEYLPESNFTNTSVIE